MSWEESKLGDVITLKRGYDLPNRLRIKGSVPIISSAGFSGNHSEHKYDGEGVITGRYGTLGEVFYINGKYWPLNTTLYVKDFKNNHPKFIYYLLKELNLSQYNGASAVPGLDRNVLHSIRCSVPSFQIQKRIASILSNYDDLIDVNLKRIMLIERALQNEYSEWFVKMRFPGYEESPIDSKTLLPEGWKETGLCECRSFKHYKSKLRPFAGVREYLPTANLNGISIEKRGDSFTYDNKPTRAQFLPPLNSIWFARMSKTNKVLIVTEKTHNNFMISSGFAGFKAEKREVLPFLFCLINNPTFSSLKDANATGSTQVSINNKSLNNIKVIEPTDAIVEKFGKMNYDLLEQIQHLFKINAKLKAARDILQPRLMNQTIKI